MNWKITTLENARFPWNAILPRLLVLMFLTASLCSCGVYEVISANPDNDDQCLTEAVDLLVPPLLITGSSWPKTSSANDFQPLSYWASFIQARNEERMTPERAKEILTAMDRCFGDKDVKKMSDAKIESLFGSPDEKTMQSGWKVYIYRIEGGKFGERRLVRS